MMAKQRREEAARSAAPAAEPQQRVTNAPVARTKPRGDAATPDSPQVWLERIVRLRAEGRHDDADAELRRFSEAYPDVPVPAEARR
jgi:hypothetical protein